VDRENSVLIEATDADHVPERIRARFQRLANEWKTDTRFLSSTTEIAMHASYQKIIGMGPAVVPLILQELSREPDQWFWALRAITDANPVKPESSGVIEAIAADWLRWGNETKQFLLASITETPECRLANPLS
jgi:hypothetical protein